MQGKARTAIATRPALNLPCIVDGTAGQHHRGPADVLPTGRPARDRTGVADINRCGEQDSDAAEASSVVCI